MTDPEAPETSVSLMIIDSLPDNRPRDTEYMRDGFVISLMNSMMRTRFSEIAAERYSSVRFRMAELQLLYPRNYNALSLSATARENEEGKGL